MTGNGADEQEPVGAAAVEAATAVVRRYWREGCRYGTRIEVEVRTPVALGHALEDHVTEQLGRLPRALPPLQRVAVLFDPGGARSVSAHVRPVGADPAFPPVPEPRSTTGPTSPARHLRLVLDGAVLGYHLPPLRGAVALLRPAEPGTTAPDAIRLPPGFAVVPSGHLVDVVPDGGGHAVRRTGERDTVEVTVDGVPVPPGEQRRLGESGTLGFVTIRGSSGVTLDYQLLPPDAPGTEHRAATVEGDLRSDTVRVRADFEPVEIRVEPPTALDVARPQFPVWVEKDVWLVADQLTTTGLTVGGEQRWHVKVYLCATAQHAAGLRSHLGQRSETIGLLNARARREGAVRGREVVMTPVYVARPPSEGVPAERTEAYPAPARQVPGGPGSGFVEWFARGDNLDPDRVVVTVSRWYTPVDWAMNPVTPGLEQLDRLRPVAAAIDVLHAMSWSHGDVKPQNVCWQPGDHYVLVDGDSLVRSGQVDDLRPTWAYASRAVRLDLMPLVGADAAAAVTAPVRAGGTGDGAGRGARGGRAAHTGEHDRFGFALLVLTALGGKGLSDSLVESVPHPAAPVAGGAPDRPADRRVDRPQQVRATLWTRWPEGRASLISALEEPFTEPVLRGDWSALAWLDRVAARAALDRAEPDPRDRPDEPWEPDPALAGIHRAVLADQVRAADRAGAVADLLTREMHGRAEETARRWALYTSLLVLVVGVAAVLLLVALTEGR